MPPETSTLLYHVGALLQQRFPNTLPFQLAKMPQLTHSLPCLFSCTSFTCIFIPTSLSLSHSLPISHHLKEKVQEKTPPRSTPFDHQYLPEGKASLLFFVHLFSVLRITFLISSW